MNRSRDAPPISEEKARRLGIEEQKPHGLVKVLVVVIVIMAVSVAGAFAYSAMPRSHGVTTTQITTTPFSIPGTLLSLTCGPNPQTVSAQVDCRATVSVQQASSGTAPPSGTVSFANSPGGSYAGTSCSPSGSSLVCSVTYTPSAASEGTQTLSATYPGDSGHKSSSAQFTLQVVKRPTTTSMACTPLTVQVNAGSLCTAGVSDSGSGTALKPIGTVSFANSTPGAFNSTTCTLSDGACSAIFTPALGSEGHISISASYGGDGDHLNSSGTGSSSMTAVRRTTNASVVCTPSSTTPGTAVTCVAKIQDISAGIANSPSGNFTFSASASGSVFTSATCSLITDSTSSSSCAVQLKPSTSQATQEIGGKYGGDQNHRASTAQTFALTIKARTTATSLSCSADSVTVDSFVSCTVTVADNGTGIAVQPIGVVSFTSSGTGSFSSNTCHLTSGSCSVSYLPSNGSEGSVTITAAYQGDDKHVGSSGAVTISVVQRQSAMQVTCNPSSVPVNSETTCTAKVYDATSGGYASIPAGSVVFSGTGGTFGAGNSCQLVNGQCSVAFTPDPGSEGVIQMSATYLGDTDHAASSAAPFGITVITRDVTLSVSCTPASVLPGGSSTCTVTVTDSDVGSAILPTGDVTFTSSIGIFSSPTCTLVSGTCSVTWTAPLVVTSGTATITATYYGDADHSAGSGSSSVAY